MLRLIVRVDRVRVLVPFQKPDRVLVFDVHGGTVFDRAVLPVRLFDDRRSVVTRLASSLCVDRERGVAYDHRVFAGTSHTLSLRVGTTIRRTRSVTDTAN